MKNEENKIDLLKVKKEKLQKFDARGVQTLFRNVSRNHYTLLNMVDNKAKIILTVNSIITSLFFGLHFVSYDTRDIIINLGSKILVISSMLSMIFALLSMLPHRYFGKSFNESGYKGALYAENFSKNSLTEFKQEFKRIMKRGQNIYDEMIDDLYFLGKVISIKQKILTLSVFVFLIGLITTITYTLYTLNQ
ncbi:Pycsar system effector family protein [uncultured Lutibacter sp.]|uniref:Pycsar system effector family protein n=1 Tax=Lutibacter sp. TaxID=1925666 RepID=UPI002630EDD9|nr:Pycsar system effector family protein [uncultured Lutibacter sp.]